MKKLSLRFGIASLEFRKVAVNMKTLRAAKFLVTGPLILVMLAVINLLTSPGNWWIQWPALGIGIAWVISLVRVLRTMLLLGGLAALFAWLARRQTNFQPWR